MARRFRTLTAGCLTMALLLSGCASGAAQATSTAQPQDEAASSAASSSAAAVSEEEEPELNQYRNVKLGEDGKARVIITTDLEVDDQNSFIHQCLFFNEIDLDGIVISASQFHFTGDGEHTLEEVNSNYMCVNGGDVTECRPMELDWLNNLWTNEYAEAYTYLSQNAEGYPSPEELVAMTKIGNVEFEGDVREDTEGSDWIKEAILDDDERSLFLLSWGGFNTIARALLSIAEDYQDTDEWDAIRTKVCDKIILGAYGQDWSYKDHIADLYPELVMYQASEGYAGYAIAYTAPENAQYTFRADWLKENIKFDHGSLNSLYRLVNDGQVYEGEEDEFQFGQTNHVMNKDYEDYDFIAEGDSITIINFYPVGLGGLEKNGYLGALGGRLSFVHGDGSDAGYYTAMADGTVTPKYYDADTGEQVKKPYILDIQLEWAARADWCVKGPEECNHPVVLSAEETELTVPAGGQAELTMTADDPDGDTCTAKWWVDRGASAYAGRDNLTNAQIAADGLNAVFTVPEDAQTGDTFLVQANVTDEAEAPITRYMQYVITVG